MCAKGCPNWFQNGREKHEYTPTHTNTHFRIYISRDKQQYILGQCTPSLVDSNTTQYGLLQFWSSQCLFGSVLAKVSVFESCWNQN